MEGPLLAAEHILKAPKGEQLYINSALEKYEDARANGDRLSVDVQLQSAIAELDSLKAQFLQVCTTQLFLEKVAAAAEGDGDAMPCPTMHELAEAEEAAAQEKSNLKKVKAERAASAKLLESTCKELADLSCEEEKAREELKRAVDSVRAAERLKSVTAVLERKVPEEVMDLASRVDEHDSKACEQILEVLYSDLSEKQRQQSSAEEEVAELQAKIDRNVKFQAELNSDLADYRADMDRNERKNAKAPQLREEVLHHEKLYEAMVALTRARILSIHENGVTVEIAVDRPVQLPEDEAQSVPPSTSIVYKLDMALTENGEGYVSSLKLSPPDIDSSLIVSPNQALTILQVAQETVRALSHLPVAVHS